LAALPRYITLSRKKDLSADYHILTGCQTVIQKESGCNHMTVSLKLSC
jgi:hypothetical protein